MPDPAPNPEPPIAPVEPMPNPAPAPVAQPEPAPPHVDAVIPKTRGVNPWVVMGIITAGCVIAYIIYKKTRPAPVVPVEVSVPTPN